MLLDALEEKLDKVIKDLDYEKGVFVKLSTRSPKDSCLWTKNMQQVSIFTSVSLHSLYHLFAVFSLLCVLTISEVMKCELEKLYAEYKPSTEAEKKIYDFIAYIRTTCYTLKVTDAKARHSFTSTVHSFTLPPSFLPFTPSLFHPFSRLPLPASDSTFPSEQKSDGRYQFRRVTSRNKLRSSFGSPRVVRGYLT